MRAYRHPVKKSTVAARSDASKITLKRAAGTTPTEVECKIDVTGVGWLRRSIVTDTFQSHSDGDYVSDTITFSTIRLPG